jgi:prepilin-type N-terminal cleavage/methylation domain-containing protein/prepilin-type processing-associated H-X9-DG protein
MTPLRARIASAGRRASASAAARGFTLVELLTVVAIVGVLSAILVPVVARARLAAQTAASTSNLRQLATATHAYVADNRGFFPPSMSADNNTRWHGARVSDNQPFDGAKGWLGPYLGKDGRVKMCPRFEAMDRVPDDAGNFENGAGGYGYNAPYLGGPPPAKNTDPYQPARFARLPQPGRTVMFASTALAKKAGLQEYPFAEPPNQPTETGAIGIDLQPSTHFRFNGKALVAWCDGHVSAEAPNPDAWPGRNTYRGDNRKALVGWSGPLEANGYWNPHYPDLVP